MLEPCFIKKWDKSPINATGCPFLALATEFEFPCATLRPHQPPIHNPTFEFSDVLRLPWKQIWEPSYLPASTRGRGRGAMRLLSLSLSNFEQNFAILRPRLSLQLPTSLCSEREERGPRPLAVSPRPSPYEPWKNLFLHPRPKRPGWCYNLFAYSLEFPNMPSTIHTCNKALESFRKEKKAFTAD